MVSHGVTLEILRNRFQAIVEEMASMILRAGHTVFVKETADFGAVLATPDGEVFAASLELGVTVMIGLPLKEAFASVGQYEEGDVIIANDPYTTFGMSTHLPDLFLWEPVFHEGELLCFALSFVHSSDVGGKVPGSISPTSTEIYQEGLRIRPTKLRERGVTDESLLNLILLNSRIPGQNWGDLRALLGAMSRAQVRMRELVGRYGEETVRASMFDLLDYAEQRSRSLLARLPEGSYSFTDYMEGDAFGSGAVRLKLTLGLRNGEAILDFTGTEPQVLGAINLATFSKHGHWMIVLGFVNYLRTVDPYIPYNSGLVRPIKLVAPEGSLVNPVPPAACGVRAATMTRVLDMVMACLSQAAPEIIPAAGAGQIAIALVACFDPAGGEYRVSVAQPLGGGSGARPYRDGIDGVDFSSAWLRNIPTEVLEADMPLRVLRYELRPDSAGAGRFRGGYGVTLSLLIAAPYSVVTARGLERYAFRPWGRAGGGPGSLGRTVLARPGEAPQDIGKFDVVSLQPGDVLTFHTQGGGGIGDPLLRDALAVAQDVRAGLLSAEVAVEEYGVVAPRGELDEEATRQCRRLARTASRHSAEPFSLGPEREAFEKSWTSEAQDALVSLLFQAPSTMRDFLRTRIRSELAAMADRGEAISPVDVQRSAQRILAAAGSPTGATGVEK